MTHRQRREDDHAVRLYDRLERPPAGATVEPHGGESPCCRRAVGTMDRARGRCCVLELHCDRNGGPVVRLTDLHSRGASQGVAEGVRPGCGDRVRADADVGDRIGGTVHVHGLGHDPLGSVETAALDRHLCTVDRSSAASVDDGDLHRRAANELQHRELRLRRARHGAPDRGPERRPREVQPQQLSGLCRAVSEARGHVVPAVDDTTKGDRRTVGNGRQPRPAARGRSKAVGVALIQHHDRLVVRAERHPVRRQHIHRHDLRRRQLELDRRRISTRRNRDRRSTETNRVSVEAADLGPARGDTFEREAPCRVGLHPPLLLAAHDLAFAAAHHRRTQEHGCARNRLTVLLEHDTAHARERRDRHRDLGIRRTGGAEARVVRCAQTQTIRDPPAVAGGVVRRHRVRSADRQTVEQEAAICGRGLGCDNVHSRARVGKKLDSRSLDGGPVLRSDHLARHGAGGVEAEDLREIPHTAIARRNDRRSRAAVNTRIGADRPRRVAKTGDHERLSRGEVDVEGALRQRWHREITALKL